MISTFRTSEIFHKFSNLYSSYLFAHEDVDTFYLEYDDERSGGFEPLKYVADGNILIGQVEGSIPRDEVEKRVVRTRLVVRGTTR